MDDLLQLLICLLLASILILYRILTANRSSSSSAPPGPWKLPLIGNLHQLITLGPVHRRLTHLTGKHGMGGVLALQIGQLPMVIVSSPGAAKQVLTGTGFLDRFKTLAVQIFSYNNTSLIFSPHGPQWSKIRRICDDELLRPDRVWSFRRIREAESAKLARSISDSAGEAVDLSERISLVVIGITLRAVFGGGDGEESGILAEFVAAIQRASVLSGRLDVCDLFPVWPFSWHRSAVQKAHERLDKILDGLLAGRSVVGEVGDGDRLSLVDVLLRGKGDDSRVTTQQIKPVILDMFMAGIETSSTIIEWAMSELMVNPVIMQMAQSEVREVVGNKTDVEEDDIPKLPFLDSIVKETLRLHPPIPLIARQASKDTKISGYYQIPRGMRVLINVWAIGRDPRHWEDPEEFKPERFGSVEVDYKGKRNNEYSFIPFGGGVRVCPGIWFGKANVMLPLAQLLFHFDWKLPSWSGREPQDLNMDEGNGAIVGRKNHLWLVPIKHRD